MDEEFYNLHEDPSEEKKKALELLKEEDKNLASLLENVRESNVASENLPDGLIEGEDQFQKELEIAEYSLDLVLKAKSETEQKIKELVNLRAIIEQREATIHERDTTIEELKDQMEDLRSAPDIKEALQLTEKMERLLQENEKFERQIKNQEQTINRLITEIDEKAEEISTQNKALRNKNVKISVLESKLDTYKNICSELQEKLGDPLLTIEERIKASPALDTINEKRISALDQDVENITKQKNDFEEQNRQLKERISDLEQSSSMISDIMNDMEKEKEISKDLDFNREKLEDYKKENRELQHQIEDLLSQKANLEQDVEDLSLSAQNNIKLLKDVNELKAENKKLQFYNREMEDKIKVLSSSDDNEQVLMDEISVLKNDNQRLNEENKKLEQSKKILMEKIAMISEKPESPDKEFLEIKMENDNLRNKIGDLLTSNKLMHERLKYSQKMDEKSKTQEDRIERLTDENKRLKELSVAKKAEISNEESEDISVLYKKYKTLKELLDIEKNIYEKANIFKEMIKLSRKIQSVRTSKLKLSNASKLFKPE